MARACRVLPEQEEELWALMVWYQNHWVDFIEDVLRIRLEPKQAELVRKVQDNERVEATTCHGAGKTFTSSLITLTVMALYPFATVFTTAPTHRQVETLLWQEIGRRYNSSLLPELGFPAPLKKAWTIAPGWHAEGASSDEGVKVEGFHSPTIMLYVVDEAKGVKDQIFQSIEGGMNAPLTRQLRITTPGATFGEHYECAIGKKADKWQHVHVSAWDVPRPELQKWAQARKEEWGEDNPVYKMRVLGQYVDELSCKIFPSRILRMFKNNAALVDKGGVKVLSCDVAGATGKDKTVYTYRRGAWLDRQEMVDGKRVDEVASDLIQRIKNFGPDVVVVDSIGLGMGVHDILVGKGYGDKLVRFNSNTSPQEDLYYNLKTECAFKLARAIEDGLVGGDLTDDLEYDLRSYDYTKRDRGQLTQLKLEDPEGDRSPDYGDSMLMAWSVLEGDNAVVVHKEQAEIPKQNRMQLIQGGGRRVSLVDNLTRGYVPPEIRRRYGI